MNTNETSLAESLSSVLMTLQDRNLLLPSNVVVEITAMAGLIVESRVQRWVLGHKYWRNLRIPVVTFETLAGGSLKKHSERARIAVFNRQTEQEHLPFWGMLVQDVPRNVQISEQSIVTCEENISEVEHVAVEFQGRSARIPDLVSIEKQLLKALGYST